ncbi:MAG: lipoprotein insertase outer membrane protein LolB [Gammaproteobacteria bacterium]
MVVTSLLLLAGCASVPGTAPVGPPNEAAWQAHRARLAALSDWQFQGRLGIANGTDGGSGSVRWNQQGEQVTFEFRGPFGAGALEVQGNPQAYWVRSSRGDNFVTTDPESYFEYRLRVPLPVLSMRYWVLGLPDPAGGFSKRVDAKGQLVVLEQDGWRVDYQDYAVFNGYELPTRMLIQRTPVRIKLAINAWTAGVAATAADTAG